MIFHKEFQIADSIDNRTFCNYSQIIAEAVNQLLFPSGYLIQI